MPPSSIVILTGAGISAESGLSTFRDIGGVWQRFDYRDVATPEGYARNPGLVHDFYNRRRRKMKTVQPNAAHHALARLDGAFKGDFLLVTQNVDDLHESAGARRLVHMHGELAGALCEACGLRHRWTADMSVNSKCPACDSVGRLRPDVVWFGEMPYHMEQIYAALGRCDLFVAIGTSGNVYPAAQFVEEVALAGARTVELNLEPSENHALFDETVQGPATQIVPQFVDDLLARTGAGTR